MAKIHSNLSGVDQDLEFVLRDILTDLTALKNLANALRTDHNTLATKLNADGGVTDADYAASTGSAVTLRIQ